MTLKERFEDKIFYSPDGCWYWTGSVNRGGYGIASINGRTTGAHRVSYELYKGVAPGKFFVCHHCDNPPCVNPDHLFLGTNEDNRLDMLSKRYWNQIDPSAPKQLKTLKLACKEANVTMDYLKSLIKKKLLTRYVIGRQISMVSMLEFEQMRHAEVRKSFSSRR